VYRLSEEATMHASHIDLGDRIEEWFRVVVEIPKGSAVKYEPCIMTRP
jgi:inorganic pyrophosphatase